MSPPPAAGSLKAITLTGSHQSSSVLCFDDEGLWLMPFLDIWTDIRGETPVEEDAAVVDSVCELARLQKRDALLARVGIHHVGPGATVTLRQAQQSSSNVELKLMNAGRHRLGHTLSAKVLQGMNLEAAAIAADVTDHVVVFIRPPHGVLIYDDGVLDITPDDPQPSA